MSGHSSALIVDNNPGDRFHLSRILYDRLGFSTIYPAADASAAAALLHSTQIDWVFSAWQFGERTSHKLFDLMRDHRDLCNTPRVLLFAGDRSEARSIARDNAASDYVRKPLHDEDLVRTTHRLCGLLQRRQAKESGGINCELDLGFDEFNVYPAELRQVSADFCVLHVPEFKEQTGELGDIGTLTISCQGKGQLVLNGWVATARKIESTLPCNLLEVRFALAQTDPATAERLRQLIAHHHDS